MMLQLPLHCDQGSVPASSGFKASRDLHSHSQAQGSTRVLKELSTTGGAPHSTSFALESLGSPSKMMETLAAGPGSPFGSKLLATGARRGLPLVASWNSDPASMPHANASVSVTLCAAREVRWRESNKRGAAWSLMKDELVGKNAFWAREPGGGGGAGKRTHFIKILMYRYLNLGLSLGRHRKGTRSMKRRPEGRGLKRHAQQGS